MRKHSWACMHCNHVAEVKTLFCPDCHNGMQYFPSKSEVRRFHMLRREQAFGLISDLEVQPNYNIVINGEKITTYRADFRYTRDEARIVEDVKGTSDERFLEEVFKLKRKLVHAVFGITITIWSSGK